VKARPKLSIVILAYNEEAYLPRALDSIAAQTRPPDEVIVVDNNSTDRTSEIAKSYPFVKLVKEPTQGIVFARNRGFSEATSQLIARLDADTQLPPHWVQLVHQLTDVHAGEIYAITGSANIYDLPALPGRLLAFFVLDLGFFKGSQMMFGHNALYGSNMVITRKAWNKVKGEVCLDALGVHEDVDLSVHLAQYGPIVYDNRIQVSVSKRGFVGESPAKIWWRLKAWGETAQRHRSLRTAEAS
jgi:glycosyltransferase involved in cell wall biosynthesis